MDARLLNSFGAATGIIAVLAVMMGTLFIVPAPPPLAASADEISNYYAQHQGSIQVGVLVILVGMTFFLWFFGALYGVLQAAEGGSGPLATIVAGSGFATVAVVMISFTFIAVAAFRPAQASPEVTRTLNDTSLLLTVPYSLLLVPFFVAVAVIILRTGILPAWLGWLAVVGIPIRALGARGIFEDSGAFSAEGVLEAMGTLIWFAWTLGASIVLVRRARSAPTHEH